MPDLNLLFLTLTVYYYYYYSIIIIVIFVIIIIITRREKRWRLHSKVSQGSFLQSGENREQASEDLQQTVTLKFSLIIN